MYFVLRCFTHTKVKATVCRLTKTAELIADKDKSLVVIKAMQFFGTQFFSIAMTMLLMQKTLKLKSNYQTIWMHIIRVELILKNHPLTKDTGIFIKYGLKSRDFIMGINMFIPIVETKCTESGDMNYVITEWQLTIHDPSPKGDGHKFWAGMKWWNYSQHQTNI